MSLPVRRFSTSSGSFRKPSSLATIRAWASINSARHALTLVGRVSPPPDPSRESRSGVSGWVWRKALPPFEIRRFIVSEHDEEIAQAVGGLVRRPRKVIAASSAEASWVRLNDRYPCCAKVEPRAMPARPACGAPASAAARPAAAPSSPLIVALRASCWLRTRWPPAMWPLSCAMTPFSCSGRRGLHDEAGVDEHLLAAGDERVHRRVVEQVMSTSSTSSPPPRTPGRRILWRSPRSRRRG